MDQQTLLSAIAGDTLKGLSSSPKFLLSKYFYDDAGSTIFQDIMKMPEYYLTDCELEIFTSHKKQISDAFCDGAQKFDLIELGSGDGLKTKILLRHLVENFVNFRYIPVDISHKANLELTKSLLDDLPLLAVNAQTGDYFQVLKKLGDNLDSRKVLLFLGSNIGNFSDEETNLFLGQLSKLCHKDDKVLIGFDLKKSPDLIMKAYNDPHGHTRRFNLNHLTRLNSTLKANFNLDNFEQHTDYNPENGEVKSFLVSKTNQTVHIAALEQNFHFKKWETIFMEHSRKFDFETIENLAEIYGFKAEKQFVDNRNFFVDSFWIKK